MTALHLACKHGNLEACHYIMTQGNGKSFINAQDDGGWTPLVWGCEHQRVDIVKYLHYLPFSGNRKFVFRLPEKIKLDESYSPAKYYGRNKYPKNKNYWGRRSSG